MSQIDSIAPYLPAAEGWLPKWLLFTSIVSIGNSIQAYVSLAGTREVYAGPSSKTGATKQSTALPADIPKNTIRTEQTSPVTELSARTFGTWTALSSIIRLYAAYNISDPLLYEICLWSYVIAFVHFGSEWLIFGTARWGRGIAGPVVVATMTTAWMVLQWSAYVN